MDGPNGLRPRGALVLENADIVSGQKSLQFFWNLTYQRKRWQTTKLMIHCIKSAKHNGTVEMSYVDTSESTQKTKNK